MFYHANTCKKCCNVLHVGLGLAGLLCGLLLCSQCLYRLCSGRVPYVWFLVVMFSEICHVEFECIHLHMLTFMRCVDVTLLGECFLLKPQPKQPN